MASILDTVDTEVNRVLLRMANTGPGELSAIVKEELTAAFKLGFLEGGAGVYDAGFAAGTKR